MNKYSPDQMNSFKAMLELSCSYESMYAIGEELCLPKTPKSDCEFVSIEKTIGQGDSKKAVLLADGIARIIKVLTI